MDWKINYTTCSRIWLRGGNAGERADWPSKLSSTGAEEIGVMRACSAPVQKLGAMKSVYNPSAGGQGRHGRKPQLNPWAQPMSSRLQNTFVWWYMPAIPALVWVWRGQSSRSSLPTYMESSRSTFAMRLSQTNTRKFHINWAGLLEG